MKKRVSYHESTQEAPGLTFPEKSISGQGSPEEKAPGLESLEEKGSSQQSPEKKSLVQEEVNKKVTIFGILIKNDVFYQDFLPILADIPDLLHFFLDPREDRYSDQYIHLHFSPNSQIWMLLNTMAIEYAAKDAGSRLLMKPLALTLVTYILKQYQSLHMTAVTDVQRSLSDRVISCIEAHPDNISLQTVASRLGYHPNYISTILRRESGHSFSEIVLQKRMEKARFLLEKTGLTCEQIGGMTGYSSMSNFYRAFRKYYGCSPGDLRGK